MQEQAQAQGWSKAQKLEGRNTTQGLIGMFVEGNCGAMVELNCETDFVAKNRFVAHCRLDLKVLRQKLLHLAGFTK